MPAGVAHAFCFEEAGKDYGIPPLILWAIAKTESGLNPYVVHRNSNGTYDYGVMQINSKWSKTLGPTRWASLADPCTNVKTGAWILSQCIADYGYNWKGIGCYNSRTPDKNNRYARLIARELEKAQTLTKDTKQNMTVATAPAARTPWEEMIENDPAR
jgi:hypothetical protein